MAITKEQKKVILSELKDFLKTAGSVVFVNFKGLGVEEANELRSTLREANVRYRVAKKTLIKIALNEAGYEGEMPTLDGELALAFGEDILGPAREVHAFENKFKEKVNILGGVFEGVYKNKEEMTAIATIPDRQTLYAQFVNLINSPIQGLVIALDGVANKKEA
jgi:large subunit ribosomal protein L10